MATPSGQGTQEQAEQFCHALTMVSALPRWVEDPSLPAEVQTACLESFLSNLRLLIEFLILKRDTRAIHRHDFAPGWEPETGEAAKLKTEWYGFTSEQVSHLSKSRVYDGKSDLVNVAAARLRLLAKSVLSIADEFVGALSDTSWDTFFATCITVARARL